MVAAVGIQATQLGTMVVYNYPSDGARVAQMGTVVVAESSPPVRVSQLGAMVVYRGRVADPSLKVWEFTLDSHEFYVLRVGDAETLVVDKLTGQWTNWGSGTSSRWRAKTGCNWIGAGSPVGGYATDIVVGDETFGVLYFLDPDYPYDDSATAGEDPNTFHRIAQGQLTHRGRDPIDCFGVKLTGSFGDVIDAALTAVSLSYSDDAGYNYSDAGTVDVTVGDYAAHVEWLSLGVVFSPGRLFKIEDDGAVARIDGLELLNG